MRDVNYCMRNCDAMKTGKILLCRRRIILEDERRGFLVEVSWSRIPRLKAVVLEARLIHGNRVAGWGSAPRSVSCGGATSATRF